MTELNILRGYAIKGRKGLDHWHPLLEEWLLCIERYCRVAAWQDAPFIYNERANIGVLAGAAWRSGRTALEEFQYGKGSGGEEKWKGRADLYLSCDNHEDMIEAKFAWLSLISAEHTTAQVEALLQSAVSDARNTQDGDEELKCHGVAFLPVWQKHSKKRKADVDERIRMVVSGLIKSNAHAVAWCFPERYRFVVNDAGNITPGVIMAISNIAYV